MNTTAAPTASSAKTIGVGSGNNLREYGLMIALVVIMVLFQILTNGTLFKPLNLTNLVLQNSYIIIMALGMLLVIVAGHIDLSVGSVAGFIGALAAVLMVRSGMHFVPATYYRCRRRHDWCGPGLLDCLSQDTLFHRYFGRHARLSRPNARLAGRRIDWAVPYAISAA
jgi:ribose/xylose/arabinose/galactoside ABC-type transport system permease subunit